MKTLKTLTLLLAVVVLAGCGGGNTDKEIKDYTKNGAESDSEKEKEIESEEVKPEGDEPLYEMGQEAETIRKRMKVGVSEIEDPYIVDYGKATEVMGENTIAEIKEKMAGKKFIAIKIFFENTHTEALIATRNDWSIWDDKGNNHNPADSEEGEEFFYLDKEPTIADDVARFDYRIPTGERIEGWVTFVVPEDSTNFKAEFFSLKDYDLKATTGNNIFIKLY